MSEPPTIHSRARPTPTLGWSTTGLAWVSPSTLWTCRLLKATVRGPAMQPRSFAGSSSSSASRSAGRWAAAKARRDNPEFWEDTPRDSDGTAKIALIAIDRSIGAWGTLLHAYPARMTATLEILALLSRLRLELEQEFPTPGLLYVPAWMKQSTGQAMLDTRPMRM